MTTSENPFRHRNPLTGVAFNLCFSMTGNKRNWADSWSLLYLVCTISIDFLLIYIHLNCFYRFQTIHLFHWNIYKYYFPHMFCVKCAWLQHNHKRYQYINFAIYGKYVESKRRKEKKKQRPQKQTNIRFQNFTQASIFIVTLLNKNTKDLPRKRVLIARRHQVCHKWIFLFFFPFFYFVLTLLSPTHSLNSLNQPCRQQQP